MIKKYIILTIRIYNNIYIGNEKINIFINKKYNYYILLIFNFKHYKFENV